MSKKILIAEDEFIIALDLKSLFKDFEVAISRTAESYINQSKSFQPDLLISDINLKSNIDGITATSIIQQTINIPVIFISAYADDFKERLAEVSNYYFIPKPINSNTLLKQVEDLLHGKFIPVNF